ncbi:MAG: macro domain-containing protein [Candidatus Hadarchaeum sp.]|uniref:macro domain-containing protein n=1 Tax=Candidatus Hadarchaeum sp. TaxID=2883567 RepID=UPI003D0A5044
MITMTSEVTIEILEGDITKQKADAICNPANSLLLMGGGAAGAIKRAGGVEIEKEALKYAPVPVGQAVATGAGKLNSKWVIHAPTMERPAMSTTAEKVYLATKAALVCAERVGAKELVLPGMGTGVGGVSPEDAAEAMMRAIAEFKREAKSLKKIILCDIDREMVKAWQKAGLKPENILTSWVD